MTNDLIFVKERDKTKRARDKLKKRLEKLEKEITQDALKRKVIEIHDRISRHAANREILTRKSLSLFDDNQNSASLSKKVAFISNSIKQNNAIFMDAIKNTEGDLKSHDIKVVE